MDVEGGAKGPTVLLVDDDRSSLDLLAAYLEPWSVEVQRCQDGRRALESVRRAPPTAVLLDVRLPGMDGWDVLRSLKADPVTADIPVVMVTIVDERMRGLALGASAYLTKPVSRDDLIQALRGAGVLEPTQQSLEVQ